jgi:hypothetical protein
MTGFIAETIEFFIVSYALWVAFCVLTYTTKKGELTYDEFKSNLTMPLAYGYSWIRLIIDKVQEFIKENK